MGEELKVLIQTIVDNAKTRSEGQRAGQELRRQAQEVLNSQGLQIKVSTSDVAKAQRAIGKSVQDENRRTNQVLKEQNEQAHREELTSLKEANKTKLTNIRNAGNEQRAVSRELSKRRIADTRQAYNEQNTIQSNANRIALENIRQQGRVELESVKSVNRQRISEIREANKNQLALWKQNNTTMGQLSVQNTISQMNAYKTNNSKAFGRLSGAQFTKEFNAIQTGLKNGTMLTTEASKRFEILKNNIDAAGKSGKTFGGMLKEEIGHLARYYIAAELIMAPIRAFKQAIDTMKEVDSELVNIQKVTGATAEKMKELTKEAYAMATAYGRTPTEFLKSVTAFSRAGYGEMASELGELSMLAQNVGDINEEIADGFLLSADAAWKYSGNVEDLRRILDGFNELSNRTATDVEKLAEGIQVSGSIFAQAGLSAQDYAGIIGTATAKTQLSGNEMSRAWRTILMNINQIKGTDLETGEIIDEDKLAKSEKTLRAIGINIREVVNGQNELRNPMQIITELANKWKDLSSIQQAAIQEALAGRLLPERIEMCA